MFFLLKVIVYFFRLELSDKKKKSIIYMHFKDQTILLLIKKPNCRLIKGENDC